MKTLILSFFVYFICAFSALAQPKLFLGPEIEKGKKYNWPEPLGKIGENTFMFKVEGFLGTHYFLERFNSKLALEKREELIVNPANEGQKFEAIKLWGGVLYFFTSYINEATEKHILFVSEIDPVTLIPKTKRRVVMEYPIINHSKTFPYEFFDSKNGMLHMIYGNVPVPNGERKKCKVLVLTPSLDKIWEKQLTVPVEPQLFDKATKMVDNAGNFYLSGRVFNDKMKESIKGEPNFKYVIYAWRNSGSDSKEYYVTIPGKFVSDFVFGINPQGEIVGCGFYSFDGTFGMQGTFFVSIDSETGKVSIKGSKEFDRDFLELFMTEKQAEKRKELYEFDLRDLVFSEDGGVQFIAEQHFITINSQTSSNGERIQTDTYHFNDIIIVSFSSDGNVRWITQIPKFQTTTNDGGYISSFFLGVNDDTIFLIYNDSPKNINIREREKLTKFPEKESVIVMVKVFSGGDWDKSILFENKGGEVYTPPKVMKQFEENGEILVYGYTGKTFRFGTLKF